MCHSLWLCWARPGCDVTHLIPSSAGQAGEPGYSPAPAGDLQFHLSQVSIGMSLGVGRDPTGGSNHETKGSNLKIHLPCSLSSSSIKKKQKQNQVNQKP